MSPSTTELAHLSVSCNRFSAQLEGDSRWIKVEQHRRLTVSFTPQREGLYEAILELTFFDHSRQVNFEVKRMLSGSTTRAVSKQDAEKNKSTNSTVSQPINGYLDGLNRLPAFKEEDLMDSDGTGLSVSHARGLDFGIVERKRPDGPFPTPSSLLIIKHADGFPAVTFVKEKTRTLDGSDPEWVMSLPQFCLEFTVVLGLKPFLRVTVLASGLVQRALCGSSLALNSRVCSRQIWSWLSIITSYRLGS